MKAKGLYGDIKVKEKKGFYKSPITVGAPASKKGKQKGDIKPGSVTALKSGTDPRQKYGDPIFTAAPPDPRADVKVSDIKNKAKRVNAPGLK